jgi:hypothetical protein
LKKIQQDAAPKTKRTPKGFIRSTVGLPITIKIPANDKATLISFTPVNLFLKNITSVRRERIGIVPMMIEAMEALVNLIPLLSSKKYTVYPIIEVKRNLGKSTSLICNFFSLSFRRINKNADDIKNL